ncbi:AAA family ATPase [Rarobacter incanus]|uniref:MoxR-like ATPase n=1 Tax=Rarobacter incanus TaxID=153494 RepID=A0A542SQF8_9MICO|nr:MoxR family ATPase [Rarobacter incanus]TQK76825.1 MoxR-like ATPase [Rarobacter incanus]
MTSGPGGRIVGVSLNQPGNHTESASTGTELMRAQSIIADLHAGMASVITGHDALIRTTIAVLLARGHILIEDVPGVGKTTLAKALAALIDTRTGRIQFTPDLLPSDVTGVTLLHDVEGRSSFRPGPVFANIVIADEINRASPKAQSALLECMAERQVTVGGRTYRLPDPFLVVATQNPIEMEGTYPLPEAQRDRFMAKLEVGYPSAQAELLMLDQRDGEDPLDALRPVVQATEIAALTRFVHTVYISPVIKEYLVAIVAGTRAHPAVRVGASPRATLQLAAACRALAVLHTRNFVIPDDVQEMVGPVLAHRLVLAPQARAEGVDPAEIVRQVVTSIPVPRPA